LLPDTIPDTIPDLVPDTVPDADRTSHFFAAVSPAAVSVSPDAVSPGNEVVAPRGDAAAEADAAVEAECDEAWREHAARTRRQHPDLLVLDVEGAAQHPMLLMLTEVPRLL